MNIFNQLLILSALFVVSTVSGDQTQNRIQPISNCVVKLDDGRFIDLTSLDNSTNPKTDQTGLDYVYKFNPCSPITCALNINSAICQESKNGGKYAYDLGDQNSAQFSYDGSLLAMKFSSEKKRTSLVYCVCDTSANNSSLKFINEEPVMVYHLRLTSKCCCPNGC